MSLRLSGKKIAILVAGGTEELEFFVSKNRLEEEGAEVIVASIDGQPVRGKLAPLELEIEANARIEDLDHNELFSALVQGGWGPDKLRRFAPATQLFRDLDAAGKPLGIMCHGGLVAISAGIVAGRPATGTWAIKDDLINAGATWVEPGAFRDGNRVWGGITRDIPAFSREYVALLVEAASEEEARAAA